MFENLYLNFATAIAACLLLFLLTLLLTVKKWISPATTLVLLIFTLLTGVIIANVDLVRYHFTDYDRAYHLPNLELLFSQFQEDSRKNYETLKLDLEIQKRHMVLMQAEIDSLKKKNGEAHLSTEASNF